MSISIGTSTPSTVRDTHAAWLRRREDSRPLVRDALADRRTEIDGRPEHLALLDI